MRLRDIIDKMENGEAHVLLYDTDGVVILSTIWYNTIPSKLLDREINHISVRDYEIRLEIQ